MERNPPARHVPYRRQQPLLPQHPVARACGGKPDSHGVPQRGAIRTTTWPHSPHGAGATWPYRNWELNFNFRNQDYDAEKYTQYSKPEYLSSTDSVVVAMRRLFVEHNRDVLRRRQREEELPEVIGESKAEQMVREGDLKVAETSGTFDAGRLEEELLRRV